MCRGYQIASGESRLINAENGCEKIDTGSTLVVHGAAIM
jgi:hypothetical protein